MTRTENKIVRVSLSGGLIGLIGTNPRKALDDALAVGNNMGYRCTYFIPHNTTNILIKLLQLVVLVLTLGLWTFGAGYLVLFEKEVTE